MKPLFTQTTVLDVVPFGNSGSNPVFFALRLAPPAWAEWRSGQFIMLRLSTGTQSAAGGTVWGRPFSICQVTSRDLVVFFQVVGRATAAMSRLSTGDSVDIWGPLGNGMAVETEVPTLLLAGGIGIAPFIGYVHSHPAPGKLSLEFGHRMPLDCYPFDSLTERITATAHLDSGEDSRAAFLTLVDKRIAENASQKGLVLACGPTPFLRTVQSFSLAHKARAQLCLETRMACGVGACLGCVVKAAEGGGNPVHSSDMAAAPRDHTQTCTCGPNFWADAVTI